MTDHTETALRRTIKDLIEAGQRLAIEANWLAVNWPERNSTIPSVLRAKIALWDEAVTRSIDPE
jgi:uncharacterized protein (DUF362 family)